MKTHFLKCWPEFFQQVWDGNKPWELRKDDRGYEEGDALILSEWDPKTEAYTGRAIVALVAYILRGPAFGLQEGYCIMSIPARANITGMVA